MVVVGMFCQEGGGVRTSVQVRCLTRGDEKLKLVKSSPGTEIEIFGFKARSGEGLSGDSSGRWEGDCLGWKLSSRSTKKGSTRGGSQGSRCISTRKNREILFVHVEEISKTDMVIEKAAVIYT